MRTSGRLAVLLAVTALLAGGALLPLGSAAPAPRPAATAGTFLSVYQSPIEVTPTSSFTVHAELSSSTNVTLVYFTFCQLTSSKCYLPIMMTRSAGSTWYTGTTKSMTAYPGMTAGVQGGYNITVDYANGSNATAPVLPNPFQNFTIAQTITGENMFEVTVKPFLFPLTGRVVDSTSGAPIVGATVALSPGSLPATTTNATGGYAFAGLANGSYNLTVSKTGYEPKVYAVTIAGAAASKVLPLTSTSGTTGKGGGTGNSTPSPPFLSRTTGLLLLAGVILAVVVLAVVMLRRRPKSPSPAAGPAPAPSEPGDRAGGSPPGT